MPERSFSVGPALELAVRTRFKRTLEQVRTNGLSVALEGMFYGAGVDIQVNWEDDQTREDLKHDPALVLVNHPYLIESLVATSALERDHGVYLMATSRLSGMVTDDVRKQLISVRLDNKKTPRFYSFFSKAVGVDPSLANKESTNINVIRSTVDILQSGGVVVMCPSGDKDSDEEWSGGVGLIVKLLSKNAEGQNVNIVNAYVGGTSKNDPFILALKAGRLFGFSPTVHFSSGVKVQDMLQGGVVGDRLELTQTLHQNYKNWSTRINHR